MIYSSMSVNYKQRVIIPIAQPLERKLRDKNKVLRTIKIDHARIAGEDLPNAVLFDTWKDKYKGNQADNQDISMHF